MHDENDMNIDQDDVTIEPLDTQKAKKPAQDADIGGDVSAEALAEEDEFVAEDGEGNTGNQKDIVKDLREKLKKAIAEKQEYLDGWQRAKADFVNIRKRDEEEKREFRKFPTENIIAELVPVLESFEMARANKAAWEAIDKNWRMGVEYIQTQLLKTLSDNGLQEIDPLNQKFDPSRDEAVSYEPTDDQMKDHVIIDVIQKGYSLNGKIIKAPRVKVGEYKQ